MMLPIQLIKQDLWEITIIVETDLVVEEVASEEVEIPGDQISEVAEEVEMKDLKCTKLLAEIAEINAKYHSDHQATDRCFARIASVEMMEVTDLEEIPAREASEEIVTEEDVMMRKCIKLLVATAEINAKCLSDRLLTSQYSAANASAETKAPARILRNPMNNWK